MDYEYYENEKKASRRKNTADSPAGYCAATVIAED